MSKRQSDTPAQPPATQKQRTAAAGEPPLRSEAAPPAEAGNIGRARAASRKPAPPPPPGSMSPPAGEACRCGSLPLPGTLPRCQACCGRPAKPATAAEAGRRCGGRAGGFRLREAVRRPANGRWVPAAACERDRRGRTGPGERLRTPPQSRKPPPPVSRPARARRTPRGRRRVNAADPGAGLAGAGRRL